MAQCSAPYLHKVLYNLGPRYPSGLTVFYCPLILSTLAILASLLLKMHIKHAPNLGSQLGIMWFSFSFKILLRSASLWSIPWASHLKQQHIPTLQFTLSLFSDLLVLYSVFVWLLSVSLHWMESWIRTWIFTCFVYR